MPILKQAKKRVRQEKVRQERNYNVRTSTKKAIRAVVDAVKSGDATAAQKVLFDAYKKIDTAQKKNIMHKRTASRRKSSLAKAVAAISAGKEKTKAQE